MLWLADQFVELGVSELYVADSIAMGYPKQVQRLTAAVMERFPSLPVIVHLHNTRGMALPTSWPRMEVGATTFDASIGGLGGRPFVPGASGNICTEDLVHMLHGLGIDTGIDTGIDLDGLLATSARVEKLVGHRLEGAVVHASKSFQPFPIPPQLLAPEGVRTVQDVGSLAFKVRPPADETAPGALSASAVRDRIRHQLIESADHVCVQVLSGSSPELPLEEWSKIAPSLGLPDAGASPAWLMELENGGFCRAAAHPRSLRFACLGPGPGVHGHVSVVRASGRG